MNERDISMRIFESKGTNSSITRNNSSLKRADQLTFINQIIQYLTTNGTIDKTLLFEPPFTNLHDQSLFGVFDEVAIGQVIKLIDTVNHNALVDKKITM